MNSKHNYYDPATKIWSGKFRHPIYNTEANVGYLFFEKLIQNPQNVCQISADTGKQLTNSEMYEKSLKFAKHFKDSNLKQGDVVGVIARNCENLAPMILGCFVLGIAINPMSVMMGVDEIVYNWSKNKPKVIFSDEKIVNTVKQAVDEMKLNAKIYTLMKKVDGFGDVNDILSMDYDVSTFE